MAKKRKKKPAFEFYHSEPKRRFYAKDKYGLWLCIGNKYDMIRYRCDRRGVPILARLMQRELVKCYGSKKKLNVAMEKIAAKLGFPKKKEKKKPA